MSTPPVAPQIGPVQDPAPTAQEAGIGMSPAPLDSPLPATPLPTAPQPPAPTDASGKPALWRGILAGALEGLGGARGATHFGGGLAAGAAGQQAYAQQQKENDLQQQQNARANAQSKAQVASTQASTAHTQQETAGLPQQQADAHATAGLENAGKAQGLGLTAQFADAQSAKAVADDQANYTATQKLPAGAQAAQYATNNSLNDFMHSLGVSPIAVSKDDHDSVVAALNGIGQNNPNKVVPHLLNIDLNGQHVAYDLTQLAGQPQALSLINARRAATLQQPVTAAQWAGTPPAAKTQQLDEAAEFMTPKAPTNAENAMGTYLQYRSILDAYQKSPNQDPKVLAGLQGLTSQLKTKADGMTSQAKELNASKAYQNAYGQTMGRNDANNSNYQQLASGDVTGWQPREGNTMTGQQFQQANTKFVNGRLDVAENTENAYNKFEEAKKAYQAGDFKTGAASMQALFAHIQTTTAGLKGMRQTADIIHEHQNAIGLADKAQRFMDQMSTGQALSANQWNEFGSLIKTARDQGWSTAVDEAHANGLPITKDAHIPDDVPVVKVQLPTGGVIRETIPHAQHYVSKGAKVIQ